MIPFIVRYVAGEGLDLACMHVDNVGSGWEHGNSHGGGTSDYPILPYTRENQEYLDTWDEDFGLLYFGKYYT